MREEIEIGMRPLFLLFLWCDFGALVSLSLFLFPSPIFPTIRSLMKQLLRTFCQ